MDFIGTPAILAHHENVAGPVEAIEIGRRRPRRQQHEAAPRAGSPRLECREGCVPRNRHGIEIIDAGAAKMPVACRKTAGPTIAASTPKQAHMRSMVPAFWGMSG